MSGIIVHFSLVGYEERPVLDKRYLPHVPRVGESVVIPQLPHEPVVRSVTWFPWGDEESEKRPFVYVVLGPAR